MRRCGYPTRQSINYVISKVDFSWLYTHEHCCAERLVSLSACRSRNDDVTAAKTCQPWYNDGVCLLLFDTIIIDVIIIIIVFVDAVILHLQQRYK